MAEETLLKEYAKELVAKAEAIADVKKKELHKKQERQKEEWSKQIDERRQREEQERKSKDKKKKPNKKTKKGRKPEPAPFLPSAPFLPPFCHAWGLAFFAAVTLSKKLGWRSCRDLAEPLAPASSSSS